jgi:hypothetical protein
MRVGPSELSKILEWVVGRVKIDGRFFLPRMLGITVFVLPRAESAMHKIQQQ